MHRIIQVESEAELESIRELFLEYEREINVSLCFQNFEQELSQLPGEYALPDGILLLGFSGDRVAGCVAMRKIDETTCEMKRMYVRPPFRGTGLGRELAEQVMRRARMRGYKSMKLDTLGSMKEAIILYRSLGFHEIEPYRYNPLPGALFLGVELTLPSTDSG